MKIKAMIWQEDEVQVQSPPFPVVTPGPKVMKSC